MLYQLVGGEDIMPSGYGQGCHDLGGWCVFESWITLFALYAGRAVFF